MSKDIPSFRDVRGILKPWLEHQGADMSDEKPRGPFVLWTYRGYEGWSFTDHATFDEAIDAIGQWSAPTWVITEAPVKITWTKDTP